MEKVEEEKESKWAILCQEENVQVLLIGFLATLVVFIYLTKM